MKYKKLRRRTMTTTITILHKKQEVLSCEIYREPSIVSNLSLEEILEIIQIQDYSNQLPEVPSLEGPIEIRISTNIQVPDDRRSLVQNTIKEIVHDHLYYQLEGEIKDILNQFKAQHSINNLQPYIQDLIENLIENPDLTPTKK